MTGLTLLMGLFTIVLFLFLLLLRREIVMIAAERTGARIAIVLFSLLVIVSMLLIDDTLDHRLRGMISGFIFLSFALDSKGLANDRIVIHPMNIKGIAYPDIDRIVLYQEKEGDPIKMNYFRRGIRGPLLKFKQPMAEIVVFLSEHLKEGTPIDILVDHDDRSQP
ncbi:hypothetical protein [Enterococcus sp. RIT-PI-f]|jgi:hypothetical protein|uniref:hypothetical protein n=1 Tax=Enterococcus sp. RIT-PI-f TaxID=1690244 RepID=UPI0006B94ADB|nr:hypothetical protein [Enterococcus sp. RIT-PI-f]KPG73300.1 hypothetical protein AEQ18_01430 [Enterococcus sp. RIT-PI-f]